MANQVEAIYEHGVLRPLQPVELSEGEKVTLSLIRLCESPPGERAHEVLSRIAAFANPKEGDRFSGKDHNDVHYGEESP